MTTEQKNLIVAGTIAFLGITLGFVIVLVAITRAGMHVIEYFNECPF